MTRTSVCSADSLKTELYALQAGWVRSATQEGAAAAIRLLGVKLQQPQLLALRQKHASQVDSLGPKGFHEA